MPIVTNRRPRISAHYSHESKPYPGSRLPVVHYKKAFCCSGPQNRKQAEFQALLNGWQVHWTGSVGKRMHFHSTSHEALAVIAGSATLEIIKRPFEETQLEVRAGSLLVIPAGVAHHRLNCTPDFRVIGMYPSGCTYDMCYGKDDESYTDQCKTIAHLAKPLADPLFGVDGVLMQKWIL